MEHVRTFVLLIQCDFFSSLKSISYMCGVWCVDKWAEMYAWNSVAWQTTGRRSSAWRHAQAVSEQGAQDHQCMRTLLLLSLHFNCKRSLHIRLASAHLELPSSQLLYTSTSGTRRRLSLYPGCPCNLRLHLASTMPLRITICISVYFICHTHILVNTICNSV